VLLLGRRAGALNAEHCWERTPKIQYLISSSIKHGGRSSEEKKRRRKNRKRRRKHCTYKNALRVHGRDHRNVPQSSRQTEKNRSWRYKNHETRKSKHELRHRYNAITHHKVKECNDQRAGKERRAAKRYKNVKKGNSVHPNICERREGLRARPSTRTKEACSLRTKQQATEKKHQKT